MTKYQTVEMAFRAIDGFTLTELLTLAKLCTSGKPEPCVHCTLRGLDDCSGEVIKLLETVLLETAERCSVLLHCVNTGARPCVFCVHSARRELHPCDVDGTIVPDCKAGARECGDCRCRGCNGYSLFVPARE